MITISRHKARLLRSVFRRAVLGIRHKGTIPPLVVHAEGVHLRARFQYGGLAVEYVESGHHRQLDSIPVPLDVLAEIEGRDDTPVFFEAAEPDRTIVRWQDRGVPQVRELPVTPFGHVEPFPESPGSWTEAPDGLLTALAEAVRDFHRGNDPVRPELHSAPRHGAQDRRDRRASTAHPVRVRLPLGRRRADRGSPIFACKALDHDEAIRDRQDRQPRVFFASGPGPPTTRSRRTSRFPAVEEAIPGPESRATMLQIDPDDGQFLQSALERLPGDEELNSPVTIDMNGKVAIRARGEEGSQVTELVLNRSSYTGQPIRINSNREFLGRRTPARLPRDRHLRHGGSDRLPRAALQSTPGSR